MRGARLGPYELCAELGSGGMGAVYLGVVDGPKGFRRVVAIKVAGGGQVNHSAYQSMFLREARLAARIHHPNVCSVFDAGMSEGRCYLAMEYLSGVTLQRLVPHLASRPGGATAAAHIIADACAGLHAAHEQRDDSGALVHLVHRDVSPDNLLLTYDGVVKVADFGVAYTREFDSAGSAGKWPYMAPEALRGELGDRRMDVWALGAVLFELLTGQRLHAKPRDPISDPSPPPPSTLAPHAATLDHVVLRALADDPDDRYQSAQALEDALHEVLKLSEHVPTHRNLRALLQDIDPRGFAARDRVSRLARMGALRLDIPARTELPTRREASPSSGVFIGRDRELGRLSELLDEPKAVTLLGIAGVGKSRLVAELVGRLHPGAVVVDAHRGVDGDGIFARARRMLGLGRAGSPPSGLSPSLLVLDGVHPSPGARAFVEEVRRERPGLPVLVTSRRALGFADEIVLTLPPLSTVSGSDAMQLLQNRAGITDLGAEGEGVLLEIVKQLDGIPRAIELLAPTVRLFGPEGALASLCRDDLPAPVRVAVEDSLRVLGREERLALDSLAVFAGRFSVQAAIEVLRGSRQSKTAWLLALVDAGFARRVRAEDEAPAQRLELLPVIRRVLCAGGVVGADVRERHMRYLSHRAEQASTLGAVRGLARLEADRADMIEALHHAIVEERPAALLPLALALDTVLGGREPMEERMALLAKAFAKLVELGQSPDGVGQLGVRYARALRQQGELQRAVEVLTVGLTHAQRTTDRRLVGAVYTELGDLHLSCGRQEEAGAAYASAQAVLPGSEVSRETAHLWRSLGVLHQSQGQLAQAQGCFELACTRYLLLDEPADHAKTLHYLAGGFIQRGGLESARAHIERGLSLAAEVCDQRIGAVLLGNRAIVR
ncbi:MAG TPA: hypothetical protein ENK57_14530, partial [Polyangiaceae bacterium]|nr:hypothetical protein [Polyangiaceae bacterium]